VKGGERVLAARGLEVGYGRGPDGFTLRVPELSLHAGEALAVLGPNGSGKSTLLRALAGLLPLRAGEIEGSEREAALVFQRPLVVAGSVAHNAELPLWARGVARGERRRRAEQALAAFGIAPLARRRADTLSGGELRRLALARAFVSRPELLLLDEPFDDLDERAREALSADLRRAVDDDLAVALVTHDLRQALLLADRVAVLVGGRLLQVAPRDEVLRRPASAEVARLVGMVNLLPGRVLGAHPAGRLLVELPGGLRLEAEGGGLDAGTPVWVGIRPENVKLDPPAHGEAVARTDRAQVLRIVSDGMLATAWLDWSGVELRTHLVAGRGLGAALKRGDAVWLAVRPEDVHLLPRDA
jgi:ABC-type Fe3+/spermidine/putrescine transport system ATPase subunit